jgi:sigma-B regulation protein RsbQ
MTANPSLPSPALRVRLRGAEIAVETQGRGPHPLVLVHGFQNDRSAWRPLLERLDRARFTATSFDLVGCGQSSRPETPKRCSIAEYAGDLIALCDQLRIERPVVVGHSLGGGTALRAALDAPGRFRALVLVAPVSTTGLDFVSAEAFPSLARPSREEQRARRSSDRRRRTTSRPSRP